MAIKKILRYGWICLMVGIFLLVFSPLLRAETISEIIFERAHKALKIDPGKSDGYLVTVGSEPNKTVIFLKSGSLLVFDNRDDRDNTDETLMSERLPSGDLRDYTTHEVLKATSEENIYDVYKIHFMITDQSLANLASENIPDQVMEKLKRLENKELKGPELLHTLSETIGDEHTMEFGLLILKHAVHEENTRSYKMQFLKDGGYKKFDTADKLIEQIDKDKTKRYLERISVGLSKPRVVVLYYRK